MPERMPRASSAASPAVSSGRPVQRAQRGGDRERQLRAGAEPGMGAESPRSTTRRCCDADTEVTAERVEVRRARASRFRPLDNGLVMARQA